MMVAMIGGAGGGGGGGCFYIMSNQSIPLRAE